MTPIKHEPRFAVGQKYQTRGRHSRLCTVVDILRTYNSANELVRIRYVAEHTFMGQVLRDIDVAESTIAIGEIKE